MCSLITQIFAHTHTQKKRLISCVPSYRPSLASSMTLGGCTGSSCALGPTVRTGSLFDLAQPGDKNSPSTRVWDFLLSAEFPTRRVSSSATFILNHKCIFHTLGPALDGRGTNLTSLHLPIPSPHLFQNNPKPHRNQKAQMGHPHWMGGLELQWWDTYMPKKKMTTGTQLKVPHLLNLRYWKKSQIGVGRNL